jgi:hypothetical protein
VELFTLILSRSFLQDGGAPLLSSQYSPLKRLIDIAKLRVPWKYDYAVTSDAEKNIEALASHISVITVTDSTELLKVSEFYSFCVCTEDIRTANKFA